MDTGDRKQQLFLVLPGIMALAIALTVCSAWASRLTYPYDLEWMEGGVLAHAWRVMHGEQLYVTPSGDFIPMIYPPGYPTLLATIGSVTGLSHTLGRTLSILGTLAACGAMIWSTHRHLKQPLLGVIGAGLFLGMYEESGTFYDLVRPDAVSLGLLTWSIVLGFERSEKRRQASAVLLFLAFVVKHNAAAFGLPIAVGIWARFGTMAALQFAAWAAIPGLLFTLAMDIFTGGLFTTWILEVPASHPIVWDRSNPGTLREVARALPVASITLAIWLISRVYRISDRLPLPLIAVTSLLTAGVCVMVFQGMAPVKGIRPPHTLAAMTTYAAVGVALVAMLALAVSMLREQKLDSSIVYAGGIGLTACVTTALMRGHHGGFINVFMVLHWTLSLGFVVACRDLMQLKTNNRGGKATGWVLLVLLVQLGQTMYQLDLDDRLPTEDDRAAGDQIVAFLEDAPGPILSPFNPWLPAQAGHRPSYHLIALWDIRHNGGPFQPNVKDVLKAVSTNEYQTIVDANDSAGLGIAKHYDKVRTFQTSTRHLLPKAGWRRAPNVIWQPK